MDMNLAWLRLATCDEGTPERVLSELLRRKGVSTVLARLSIDRVALALWVREQRVPDERHVDVCETYKSLLAADYRAGTSRIDIEVAEGMEARGEKQDVIAAELGVTQQAVSKALKKRRSRRVTSDG